MPKPRKNRSTQHMGARGRKLKMHELFPPVGDGVKARDLRSRLGWMTQDKLIALAASVGVELKRVPHDPRYLLPISREDATKIVERYYSTRTRPRTSRLGRHAKLPPKKSWRPGVVLDPADV